MNEVITVQYTERRQARCVILQGPPFIVVRHATLVERLKWWLHVNRCKAITWANDNMTWRARKEAAQAIERVKG